MTASPLLKSTPTQRQPSTKAATVKLSSRIRNISTPPLLGLLEKTNPCWFCGCCESIIVPAIAPTLQASVRCINCDCLGVAGGRND
ncbi:hypothetical protein NDA03_25955 [Trichocoleus sp. Lan]